MKNAEWLVLVFVLGVMFAFIGISTVGVWFILHEDRAATAVDDAAYGANLDPLEPIWPNDPPIAFELVDHHGDAVDASILQGKVTVVMFTFTHCRGICSVMVPAMQELHDKLIDHPKKDRIQLLNISIDPQRDTVDRIGAWVQSREIDDDLWKFITDPTGEQDQTWTLIRERFRLMIEHTPENELMPFNHSPKFTLLDPKGRIVAFYNGVDSVDRQKLLRDIDRLLARPY